MNPVIIQTNYDNIDFFQQKSSLPTGSMGHLKLRQAKSLFSGGGGGGGVWKTLINLSRPVGKCT